MAARAQPRGPAPRRAPPGRLLPLPPLLLLLSAAAVIPRGRARTGPPLSPPFIPSTTKPPPGLDSARTVRGGAPRGCGAGGGSGRPVGPAVCLSVQRGRGGSGAVRRLPLGAGGARGAAPRGLGAVVAAPPGLPAPPGGVGRRGAGAAVAAARCRFPWQRLLAAGGARRAAADLLAAACNSVCPSFLPSVRLSAHPVPAALG